MRHVLIPADSTKRAPYVQRFKNGTAVDVNGNRISDGDLPEAHIPVELFKFEQ